MQIDFLQFTHGEVRNLSGQERGAAAREFFCLNDLDGSPETIEVIVPNDLDAIATSFFQGMFARSVREFDDEAGFLAHYRFVSTPEILAQIKRGIDRVLMQRGGAFLH